MANALHIKQIKPELQKIINDCNINIDGSYSRVLFVIDSILSNFGLFNKIHLIKISYDDTSFYFSSLNDVVVSDIVVCKIIDNNYKLFVFDNADIAFLSDLYNIEINSNAPTRQRGA